MSDIWKQAIAEVNKNASARKRAESPEQFERWNAMVAQHLLDGRIDPFIEWLRYPDNMPTVVANALLELLRGSGDHSDYLLTCALRSGREAPQTRLRAKAATKDERLGIVIFLMREGAENRGNLARAVHNAHLIFEKSERTILDIWNRADMREERRKIRERGLIL